MGPSPAVGKKKYFVTEHASLKSTTDGG